jgi:hypothetical protein
MLEVGYAGSASRFLPWLPNYNQALIATPQNPVNGLTTTSLANVAQRLPFLGVGVSSYAVETGLNANYNSLQVSVTKRFSHGLEFLSSYTWSKSLDEDSGRAASTGVELTTEMGNQKNIRESNYGPSLFDRTSRIVASFVYQIPGPAGGPAAVRQLASGWQLSGVTVLQSGSPFTVTDSLGASIYGIAGISYAQCTGSSPNESGSVESRLNQFFNPAAFTRAPALDGGTAFGNCGRNILRGPSELNLDVSAQKSFHVTESSLLLFRAESFNLTNTPKFGLPAANVSSPQTFGVISSTVANPRVIQLALKFSF